MSLQTKAQAHEKLAVVVDKMDIPTGETIPSLQITADKPLGQCAARNGIRDESPAAGMIGKTLIATSNGR